MLMSNYGISDKVNILTISRMSGLNVAGTLHGMKGFQDIALDLKYEFYTTKLGKKRRFIPLPWADSAPHPRIMKMISRLCPLTGVTEYSGRLTADYQRGILFATISSAYVWKSDVTIDRLPITLTRSILRTRSTYLTNYTVICLWHMEENLTAQVQLLNMYTFGGFDIQNDMPFASNQDEYDFTRRPRKIFSSFRTQPGSDRGRDFVIAGRNVGLSQTYTADFIISSVYKSKK
jgi:hypothetical protein